MYSSLHSLSVLHERSGDDIKRYVDMSRQGALDTGAQARLKHFKDVIVSKCGDGNRMSFTLPWKDHGELVMYLRVHLELQDTHLYDYNANGIGRCVESACMSVNK